MDAATAALNSAIAGLVTTTAATATVNTDALTAAIAATETLTGSGYTADSWAALEAAMQNANAVLSDPDATQDEVDEATAALIAALDALVAATGDDEDDYTDSSSGSSSTKSGSSSSSSTTSSGSSSSSSSSPKTGDTFQLLLWVILLAGSAIGLVIYFRRKRTDNAE